MAKPYVEIFTTVVPPVIEVIRPGAQGPMGEEGPVGPEADPQDVADEVLEQLIPPVDLEILFENALV